MTKCCVLGLGYIGLPTSVVLASVGHTVVGVDIEEEVVDLVNQGICHFSEPGLELEVAKYVSQNTLTAKLEPEPADVFIIAVPTPFHDNQSEIPQPNINYVLKASENIAPFLRPGNLVILESTSPVGTTEKIALNLSKLSGIKINDFNVAYCPERVLPGKILLELFNNDRVIGGISESSSIVAKDFYTTFCKGQILITNSQTAELVKLAENAFRDVNIAFANELSMVCNELRIDIRELIKIANHHPRVKILQPGCGVGGHCIAVDPWFIASTLEDSTPLIQSARAVNENKWKWVANDINTKAQKLKIKLGRNPLVGCLGLSYKPDVEDLRESPALKITNQLLSLDLNLMVCEPNLRQHSFIKLYELEYINNRADLIVILVAHSEFKKFDFNNANVVDYCGIN